MTSERKDRRSDAELVFAFVNQHDQAAINAIVERHGPMVMGVCRNILRHPQAADDAFQAKFLALLKKARLPPPERDWW